MTNGPRRPVDIDLTEFFRLRDQAKAIIVGELAHASPESTVVQTRYFHHSFLPDATIQWQNTSDTRDVFFRDYSDVSVLRREVNALSSTGAIIYLWSIKGGNLPRTFFEAIDRAESVLVVQRGALALLTHELRGSGAWIPPA